MHRASAQERMQRLLEHVRKEEHLSEEDAISFCDQELGVSQQTCLRYLQWLERAGLIRVSPDGIYPWSS